jgi:DNA-binding response OmpR family regulator
MTDLITSSHILVVDDDPSIRFFLQEALERDGYKVTVFDRGSTAIEQCEKQAFDLVLLDLKLGDMDGMVVLRELKQRSPTTAIILLTAYATLETAVEALRQGASDYLFKPCKTLELRHSISQALQKRQQTLRQQVLLQKLEQNLSAHLTDIRSVATEISVMPTDSAITDSNDNKDRFLQKGDLIIDLMRHAITLNETLLELSPTEFNLLAYLVSESPRVVSPQELVREVQGYSSEPWEARDLARFHIYRLRQKIKTATGRDNLIDTVRGVGYSIAN